MDEDSGKKWPNGMHAIDGGSAGERRTHADVQLERDIRAAFYAMCGKDGKQLGPNFRNVTKGHTNPMRVLVRRIKEAKRMRSPHSYEQGKRIGAAYFRWLATTHGREQITGDWPRQA